MAIGARNNLSKLQAMILTPPHVVTTEGPLIAESEFGDIVVEV